MHETGQSTPSANDDPTIVAVRRADTEAAGAASAEAGRVWRGLFFVAGSAFLLAGAVAVFVFLPGWVEESTPPPETVVETPVAPAVEVPVLSEEEIAELTKRAESLLAALLEQQQALNQRAVESWGDTTWSAYENAAKLADEAFLAEDLREAVSQYETAIDIGADLFARSERIVTEALAAGAAAITSGNPELAASQFDLVLAIEPDNAAAQRGRARADVLPDVIAAMRRGDASDDRGELEPAAAAYREALAIDPDYAAARTALDSISRRIEAARFDRLISEGYAAIDARSFDLATERFETALALRPDSDVARSGLAEAEEGIELSAIAMAEIRARAFERRELWDDAIARYREALATDPTLAFALEGLERALGRSDLDVKLEALLAAPRQILTDAGLDAARRVLADAVGVTEPGPRLTDQIERLDRLVELAATPISVTLLSDGETEVTVYRVGELGAFASRDIAIKPGEYTAVGQRRGFRDVREVFTVMPGADNGPITVVCDEPIEMRSGRL